MNVVSEKTQSGSKKSKDDNREVISVKEIRQTFVAKQLIMHSELLNCPASCNWIRKFMNGKDKYDICEIISLAIKIQIFYGNPYLMPQYYAKESK